MTWSVWQTGGRRHSYWHLVFRGPELQARARYQTLKAAQKSGALILRDGDDRAIASSTIGKARAR